MTICSPRCTLRVSRSGAISSGPAALCGLRCLTAFLGSSGLNSSLICRWGWKSPTFCCLIQRSDSLSHRPIALSSTDCHMLSDKSQGPHPVTCADVSIVGQGFLFVCFSYLIFFPHYRSGLLCFFCHSNLLEMLTPDMSLCSFRHPTIISMRQCSPCSCFHIMQQLVLRPLQFLHF